MIVNLSTAFTQLKYEIIYCVWYYSPDLNPIEIFWANFKKVIQSNLEKFKTLAQVIDFSFSAVVLECVNIQEFSSIIRVLNGGRVRATSLGFVEIRGLRIPVPP